MAVYFTHCYSFLHASMITIHVNELMWCVYMEGYVGVFFLVKWQDIPSSLSQDVGHVFFTEEVQQPKLSTANISIDEAPCVVQHTNSILGWKLLYHTQKIFGWKNFGEPYMIQVKAISKEKFGKSTTVSAYAEYIFWILARKILANGSWFTKFTKFSPALYMYAVGPVYYGHLGVTNKWPDY